MTNAYAARQRGLQALAIHDKCARVQELYTRNLTDEQIAKELGIDRSRVTQLRNQMGLPPRWGRKNGCIFTAQHDADLRELKSSTGLSWSQIAFLLDDMPVAVVYARYQLLLTMMPRASDGGLPEKVPCRRCKQPFLTPNRRQIHMCDACHKRIENLGASLDDDFQDSGGFRMAM